jgi:hypothetical protein
LEDLLGHPDAALRWRLLSLEIACGIAERLCGDLQILFG